MNRQVIYFLVLFFLTPQALLSSEYLPPIDKPHALTILLNEEAGFHGEIPENKIIGATTQMGIVSLTQAASIIIMSPSIWHNILARRFIFDRRVLRDNSPEQKLFRAYTNKTNDPDNFLHTLRETGLGQELAAYTLDLSQNNYEILRDRKSGVIICIPEHYKQTRIEYYKKLGSRYTKSYRYNLASIATGLRLSKLQREKLPRLQEIKKYTSYLDQLKKVRNQKRYQTRKLTQLFLTTRHLPKHQRAPWIVYLNGHGNNPELEFSYWLARLPLDRPDVAQLSPEKQEAFIQRHVRELAQSRVIGGIPLREFGRLLTFFNKRVETQFFYYLACYAGDEFLPTHSSEIFPKTSSVYHLNYPLAVGALTDSLVWQYYAPQPLDKTGAKWTFPVDTQTFFENISRRDKTIEEILEAVSPLGGHEEDFHSLSNTPQVLIPHTNIFQPIHLVKKTALPGVAHLTHVKNIAHYAEKRTYHVRNKRALLLSPAEVLVPIEIESYTPTFHPIHRTHTVPPALLSLKPGRTVTRLQKILLHNSGLKNFLVHSFLHFSHQKNKKVFLIDTLTLDNDLNQFEQNKKFNAVILDDIYNFFDGIFRSKLSENKQITLERVIIEVEKDSVKFLGYIPTSNNTLEIYTCDVSLGLSSLYSLITGTKKQNIQALYRKNKQALFQELTIPVTLKPGSKKVHQALSDKYFSELEKIKTEQEGLGSVYQIPNLIQTLQNQAYIHQPI